MRIILAVLLAAPLLFFIGCGPRGKSLVVEYIEGTVTLDGQPVPNVSITLIPAVAGSGTEPAGGRSVEAGRYTISSQNGNAGKGAVAGEYLVLASNVEVIDLSADKSFDEAAESSAHGRIIQKELLPSVYQDRTKTPLKITVNKGKNKIDLELKSKP
jgi:hypothetical protein